MAIRLAHLGPWWKSIGYVLPGVGVFVALILWCYPAPVDTCWVGHKKISVTVHVHDPFGNVIPAAVVELANKSDRSTATTDAAGTADVPLTFQICGRDSLLRRTGMIELLGETLTARASGFKEFHREIADMVRPPWDLYAPGPREVIVQLEPENGMQEGQPKPGVP